MASVRKTKEMVLTESIDEIMKLFYTPTLGDRQYCCQPEQINLIKKLEQDLETCSGDILLIDGNVIPKIEIRDCVDRQYLPPRGVEFKATLSTKHMYMCIILYYYRTSPLSVNKNFHLLDVLRQLIPGKNAKTIMIRTSMAEIINQRLLINKGNSPECEAIINTFKRNSLILDINFLKKMDVPQKEDPKIATKTKVEPPKPAMDFSQFTPSVDDMPTSTTPYFDYVKQSMQKWTPFSSRTNRKSPELAQLVAKPEAAAVDFSQFTPPFDDEVSKKAATIYPPIGYTNNERLSPYSKQLRYDGIYFPPYDSRLDSNNWIPEFDELTVLTTNYDESYKRGPLPREFKPEYNMLRDRLYSFGQVENKTINFIPKWKAACLDMRQFLDQFEGGVSFTNKPLFKEIIIDPKSPSEHRIIMDKDLKNKSAKIFWGGIKRRKNKTRCKHKK
jgi:hypothetical protein